MNTVKELAKKWYNIIGFPEKFDEGFEKLLQEESDIAPMKFEEYDLIANRPNKGKNLVMFLYNKYKQYFCVFFTKILFFLN